jgi:hypothetical protein
MLALLENPLTGIVIALVLGATAVSGKLSQRAANILLLSAWALGSVTVWRSGFGGDDYRPKSAGVLILGALLLLLSYWFRPAVVVKPNPTKEDAWSNEELKTRTRSLSNRIRELQVKFNHEQHELTAKHFSEGPVTGQTEAERTAAFGRRADEMLDLSAKQRGEFVVLRMQVIPVRDQLLKRLNMEKGYKLVRDQQLIDALIDNGVLAGPYPLDRIADYLDLLVGRLPE